MSIRQIIIFINKYVKMEIEEGDEWMENIIRKGSIFYIVIPYIYEYIN